MPSSHSVSRKKTKSAIALLLTFTAGVVDIVSYLSVYHLFVAHMTGTTVHLGHYLAIRRWSATITAAVVVVTFVGGSVLGRAAIEFGARSRRRTIASFTLLTEGLLVLFSIWFFSAETPAAPAHSGPLWVTCVLLASLASAMGLQTATLTRIGALNIHTTFVTGMLNKLAQSVSQWIFWVHDNWRRYRNARQAFRGSGKHPAFRNAQLMTAICFCYIVGSVTGTWMQSQWNVGALYLPVAILIFSAAVDQLQPLSIEEEIDQP